MEMAVALGHWPPSLKPPATALLAPTVLWGRPGPLDCPFCCPPPHMSLPPLMLSPTPGLLSVSSFLLSISFPQKLPATFLVPDSAGFYPTHFSFHCGQFHVFRERAAPRASVWFSSQILPLCAWHLPLLPVASCEYNEECQGFSPWTGRACSVKPHLASGWNR